MRFYSPTSIRAFAKIAILAMTASCITATAGGATTPPLPTPAPNRGDEPTRAPQKPARPAAPKTAEQRFQDEVAKLVAPVTSYALSDAAEKTLISALSKVSARKLSEARELQAKLSDPVARKLIDWHALRVGFGTPDDFVAFLKANPDWPDESTLRRRLEQALFTKGGSAREILATLKTFKPTTGSGLAAEASAYLSLGDKAEAQKLAQKAWCSNSLPQSYEDNFLKRFDALLTADAHKCRLEELLIVRLRSSRSRKAQAERIRPLIKKLPEAEQAKYVARLSMFLRQRAAPKFLKAVPASARKGDPGFAFQYAAYLRHKRRYRAAWAALTSVNHKTAALANRDTWWEELHIQALDALKAGHVKTAYALVANARPETVNPAKEQAFFAGWIALRHLKSPTRALPHFERMRKLADGPLSRSKALFWLATTLERVGKKKEASARFREAAEIRDTFHGLLARERLAGREKRLSFMLPMAPTKADIDKLVSSDVVKALVITLRAGLDRIRYPLRFFWQIGADLKTEGQFVALAQIARTLGDGQLEVRAGKMAVARGHNLYIYAYPIDYLPDYKPLRPPVERALILAIARQESEFNTQIVSHAGARGVLQVMPVTARHVCRDYKIKCRISELLKDPVYNARIGSAYIADRMEDFGGSYILTLTGYNAGPGRTRQWLRQFGDPRAKKVDALDWIYRIPFDETRAYVQKVLSNLQVYRARLGQPRALRLKHDMRRASAK